MSAALLAIASLVLWIRALGAGAGACEMLGTWMFAMMALPYVAGMRVAAVESSGNAHDWHAVQDVLRYGLAVFGHDTGLDGANPNLSDYPNLKRITI